MAYRTLGLIFLLSLLLANSVAAADEEFSFLQIGDSELFQIGSLGDEQLTISLLLPSEEDTSSAGGPGGTAQKYVGPYDVDIELVTNEVKPRSEFEIIIKLTNTGDKPDKDTVLTTYLTSPTGEKVSENVQYLLEIPPGETKISQFIYIPLDAQYGEWSVNLEYETMVQPLIKAKKTFYVVENLEPPWTKYLIFGGLALLVLLTWNRKNIRTLYSKKRKKKLYAPK